jgi:diadenosine tetraphosphatase ApaH/serine/threonine PP2A family protein phosphatase
MRIEGFAPRRVGVFSDIHGNYPALLRVLAELDQMNLDALVCCGDVVGYGGHPNECVDALRQRNIPTIAGNHDYAALERIDITYFNDIAKRSIQWTRGVLTEENRAFLNALPLTIETPDIHFVHSSPRNPEFWSYVITLGDARQSFRHFEQRVCFIGHSHTPFIVENHDNNLSCPTNPAVELRDDCRYVVNVGSVGQPRDRNPDACFAVLDLDAGTVQICRTEYDLESAQEAIRQNGLPLELAERLAYGL